MKRMTVIAIPVLLTLALLLVGVALAMGSDSYQLDWFTPLTGSGGGAASSGSYAVNLTVGQAVIGTSDSAGYAGCLGYWCGVGGEWSVYLPVVLRRYP